MLFTMSIEQTILEPPALPTPAHWSIDPISVDDGVTEVSHAVFASAAPTHSFRVSVDEVVPVARLNSFSTVMAHVIPAPPVAYAAKFGFPASVPLHCVTDCGVAADALWPTPSVLTLRATKATKSEAVATATTEANVTRLRR
ncbi:MAG: hypothetical protein JWQ19_1178 [Subtercola sp.]|nr:hypothetical protein [Subtercola sp.]